MDNKESENIKIVMVGGVMQCASKRHTWLPWLEEF